MDIETRTPAAGLSRAAVRDLAARALRRCERRLADVRATVASLAGIADPVRRRVAYIQAEIEHAALGESLSALGVLERRIATGGEFELARLRDFTFPAVKPAESRSAAGSALSGYGAVFHDGTPGTQYTLGYMLMERVAPSAFDRAIAEKQDVRGLLNHNPDNLLGRVSAGTMRLKADGRGLRYEIDLGNSRVANDVRDFLARGDLTGSSFSFLVVRESWQQEGEVIVRTLEDLDLIDTGPVTFPAYEGTSATIRKAGAPSVVRLRQTPYPTSRDSVKARARAVEVESDSRLN